MAPGLRPLISRMRASTSCSIAANSSSEISPSSSCICASSRRSRSTVSSSSSASAAATTLSRTKRIEPISRESRINTGRAIYPLSAFGYPRRESLFFGERTADSGKPTRSGSFQLQPNIHEIVGRPRPRVFERELVESAGDRFHFRVERAFMVARNQERGVHDHLVADRLVDPRRDRHFTQLLEDVGDVALRFRLQRGVDQSSVLHPCEV